MSARLPRRSFAAPFVVTLATVPACYVHSQTTASSPPPGPPVATTEPRDHREVQPAPPPESTEPRDHRHDQPAGGAIIANPPRPTTQPAPPPTRTSPVGTTTAPVERAPTGGTVIANPPRPTTQPAPTTPPPSRQPTPAVTPTGATTGTAPNPPPPSPMRKWTVRRTKGQCKAYVDAPCPPASPGSPRRTCNPPPPHAYKCPDSLADGQSLKIVKPAGSNVCQVDYGPMSCPPNTICNPPRPRTIACPK